MMETLNAVWTALTTTNEELINILLIPIGVLDVYLTMCLFSTLFNLHAQPKKKIIYVIFLSIFSISTKFFIPTPYGTILNIVFMISIIKYTFKPTFLKTLLCIFVSFGIGMVLEFLLESIYFVIFEMPCNVLLHIPIYRFSIMLIVYCNIYIIYKMCKKYNFNITIFDNINSHTKRLILFNTILSIIIIASQFFLLAYYNDKLPLLMSLVNISSLLAYFVISISMIIKTTQLEISEQNLQETRLYNKTLSILYDNMRAFKHDFSNILTGIGGYIYTEDLEGLKKYYSDLLSDCQTTNNLSALNPDTINNPSIYNLLATKYHTADEFGIKINLEIFLDLNKLNIKTYDFTRIIGILMDNAIEATKECDEKIINVIIRNEQNKNRQVVIIENTYKNKDVNLDLIFNKGVTSKPGNTGLGLWKVREILKKNENLNLYTTKNDKYFSQQFEMYYNIQKEG